MEIYGAGMAGLLTANMLRRYDPVIYESKPSLPNNHNALLRFRSDAVSVATGIPFIAVTVSKAIFFDGKFVEPNLQVNTLYSFKVTGEYQDRSIINTAPVQRFIAPPNFINIIAKSCNIVYNSELSFSRLNNPVQPPIISTIPMPALMDIVGWERPGFVWMPIWSVWAELDRPSNVCQTIYYPAPDLPYYRASITHSRVIVEFTADPKEEAGSYLEDCLDNFGIACGHSKIEISKQTYGKLVPVSLLEGRRFLLAMTDKYHMYSIGRFATWRQILLDDVVHDVKLVDSWITDRDAYNRKLKQ